MSPKVAKEPASRQSWHDKHVELLLDILRNPAHRPVGGKRNGKMVNLSITWEPIQAKLNELTPNVNEFINSSILIVALSIRFWEQPELGAGY